MRKRKGFALITTLMMSVIVIMLITAGLVLLPSHRVMTGTLDQSQRALTAAEAGVEYTRTKLQNNPGWRGDDNIVTIDEPGKLWVREDEGNIVGIVWAADGQPSLFKIRFNFQDGDNGDEDDDDDKNGVKDFLDDPSSNMIVRHKYISYNSLNKANSGPIYRAEESGNWEIDDGTSFGDVPRFASVIYCQGTAGRSVEGASPSNLEPDPAKGSTTVRTVEAFIGRDVSQYGDSVVYGAEGININSADKLFIETADAEYIPRARTLQDMITNTGGDSDDFAMDNGDVVVNPIGGRFTINGSDSSSPTASQSDSSGSFLEIGWSQIEKAPNGGGDPAVRAGTYVWEQVGGKSELVYYDVEFDPAVPTTDPRDVLYSGPAGTTINNESDLGTNINKDVIDFKKSKLEMRVKKSFNVSTSPGGALGMNVLVTNDTLLAERDRPKIEFKPKKKQDPDPIITTQGSFRMTGKLHGGGAVTAEGNIDVQGESILRTGRDTQVALYSKGDISIEPIPPAIQASIPPANNGSGSGGGGTVSGVFTNGVNPFLGSQGPGDVAFSGVIYAQGSFTANIGPTNNFHVRGVLVAFGGDSEAGEAPGTRVGSGAVNIDAQNTQLIYDSSYVANLIDEGGATTLSNISWRWF